MMLLDKELRELYEDDPDEYRAQWTNVSGAAAALNIEVGILSEAAAEAFLAKKDEVAQTLRRLLTDMENRSKEQQDQLLFFINTMQELRGEGK